MRCPRPRTIKNGSNGQAALRFDIVQQASATTLAWRSAAEFPVWLGALIVIWPFLSLALVATAAMRLSMQVPIFMGLGMIALAALGPLSLAVRERSQRTNPGRRAVLSWAADSPTVEILTTRARVRRSDIVAFQILTGSVDTEHSMFQVTLVVRRCADDTDGADPAARDSVRTMPQATCRHLLFSVIYEPEAACLQDLADAARVLGVPAQYFRVTGWRTRSAYLFVPVPLPSERYIEPLGEDWHRAGNKAFDAHPELRAMPHPAGCCRECGYALEGLDLNGRCPECGFVFAPANAGERSAAR